MIYRFPEKIQDNQKSLIRDIAERGSRIPGFISFALGNPAAESIPVEILQECAREVFEEDPMKVLQYGPLAGEAEISSWIRQRLIATKGCPENNHQVMMLTGSGKALGLVPRTLCEEGDEAFCDEFTFPNGFNSMKNVGAIPVGIPMDENGMIPEELEKQAKRGKGKYVYLIPNFQNPTGLTMPIERRKEIYEVARRYDLIIYEDDPYGEIRFCGDSVPTIKSFDDDGRVIYVGSFSKTLSAGLRVGFLYASNELIRKISVVKGADGQDPIYNQKIILKALGKMDYEEHLKTISAIYGRKCRIMADGLMEYCSSKCHILIPEGGMFIWVVIPESEDINAVSDAAIAAGVGVVKSEAFAVDPSRPGHAFRLNFSASKDEDIQRGCRIFGQITREFFD
ncbi:MAG: PLP-dependent aminotransferase family protein [Clostridiales bacterium]|nr:PLP-dependent aminotransferase family protein [Clostridiales bacterium]